MTKRTHRVARGLAAILAGIAALAGIVCPSAAHAQSPFTDVPDGHPAEATAEELAQQGLINGYTDGTYRGNQPMPRDEVAIALQRLMQVPLRSDPPPRVWPQVPVLGPPPRDVPASHWVADAVQWVRRQGIIAGYPDGTYRGDRPMAQDEFSLILQRLRQFEERFIELQREQTRGEQAPDAGPARRP